MDYSVHSHSSSGAKHGGQRLVETRHFRILGKLCPRCGVAGSVLFETHTRLIYECPGKHQYESRKRVEEIAEPETWQDNSVI